jgi:hypothetical protein
MSRYILKRASSFSISLSEWVVCVIKKKCPECGGKAVRLYQNKTVGGKRKWLPIAWLCTQCNYVYTIASDTLLYPVGGEGYQDTFHGKCPKCDLRLTRIFRHVNPVYGKQQWISTGWYCNRCKYVWMDKK